MDDQLHEINELFLRVQDYIDPDHELIIQLRNQDSSQAWDDYLSEKQSAIDVYRIGHEKLGRICPLLSPNQIIEGYNQGCRLLQRGLSGCMATLFNAAYIPLMTEAIREGAEHTAFIFVQVLTDQIGVEAAPIIVDALESKKPIIRERALCAVEQLNMISSVTKVQELTRDENELVAHRAAQVLVELRKRQMIQ